MMLKTTYYLLISLIGFGLFTSGVSAKTPDWVEKRPVDPAYYIGIGVAVKSGDGKEYLQSAKQAALSDLASEITVNISSELIDIAIEQSGLSEEEVYREIRATTAAELEGYELVDTYETKNEYWIYYRLSRATYAAKKQERLENAMNLALDFYSKGINSRNQGKHAQALGYLLEAFKPIQGYITDPLETIYNGEEIYVKNEIYSSIQGILGSIAFSGKPEKSSGKMGKPLSSVLEVRASYQPESGGAQPMADLPVRFTFKRGSGELLELVRTNSRGFARCRVARITSREPLQIVTAAADLNPLVTLDSTNAVIQGIIDGFAVPSQRFILEVQGLTAFIDSKERNFGKALEVPHLEPTLKNVLGDEGFSFVDNMSEADMVITVEADSRKGSEVYGQYVAYVDVSVSVLDMNSGEEIYKNKLSDIKGIHLDYERAGLKAYENAGEQLVETVVPSIVAKPAGTEE